MNINDSESEISTTRRARIAMWYRLRQPVALGALTILLAGPLTAADLRVGWDPPAANTDGSDLTDLAGYELSYGTSSGTYSTTLDAGLATEATLTSLDEGATYYISVKAYNAAGVKSAYSEELVAIVNMVPIAVDDLAETTSGATVTIDVLGNDYDPDGDPVAIANVYSPVSGTAIINQDGTIDYMPDSDFVGTDSFTYEIEDGWGGTATAVITVQVYAPEEPPAGGPDYLWVEAEDCQLVAPMTTVSDPAASQGEYAASVSSQSGTLEYTFDAVGGRYMIWALAAAGSPNPTAHNSFYVSIDGGDEDVWDMFYDSADGPLTTWTWDPVSLRAGGSYKANQADPWIFTLSPGTHTLTFRGRETDSRIDRLLVTSDLRFSPDVAAPTISVQPSDQTVDAGGSATFTVIAEGDGTITYQWFRDGLAITGATAGSYLLSDADAVADDGAGFYVEVINATGVATSSVATLRVVVPNQNPLALNDTAVAEANSSTVIEPLENDFDPDGDELTLDSFAGALNGTVTAGPNNTLTYTPSSMFTGEDSFTYTVSDGRGGLSSAVVSVTVEDKTPPSVTIIVPTEEELYITTNDVIDIAGIAGDAIGVVSLTYENNRSESGDMVGDMENWIFTEIPLYSGENVIKVTAVDEAGNEASDRLIVMYQSMFPKLDEAVLRAGMAVQDIQIRDNVVPGETVTVQWQILSYVPLRSALSIRLPDGSPVTNQVVNAVRTGSVDGRWHVGDRLSRLYSFECSWVVPSTPGTCRIRFLCSEQDGYAYLNANIPSGVDTRPYGLDGKEILRDIVSGTETQEVVTEEFYTSEEVFDSLSNAVLRAGGTIERISIPDDVEQSSFVQCQWDVLSYVPIRSRIRIDYANGESTMAEAELVSEKDGRWMIDTYQSKVYTFEYRWETPEEPGECRVRFLNAQSDGYAWMNGNIPGGVDERPYGRDGKEIERTITEFMFEQE